MPPLPRLPQPLAVVMTPAWIPLPLQALQGVEILRRIAVSVAWSVADPVGDCHEGPEGHRGILPGVRLLLREESIPTHRLP